MQNSIFLRHLASLSTIPKPLRVFLVMSCHWPPCQEPLVLLVQYGQHGGKFTVFLWQQSVSHLKTLYYAISSQAVAALWTLPQEEMSPEHLLLSDRPRRPHLPRIWVLSWSTARCPENSYWVCDQFLKPSFMPSAFPIDFCHPRFSLSLYLCRWLFKKT